MHGSHMPWMSLVITGLLWPLAATPVQSQNRGSDAAGEPARANAAGESADIDVRYYQTMLELAELDLRVAVQANRRVPNMIRDLTMVRLRNQVDYAAELLEQAKSGDRRDSHEAHIQSLENELELAKRRLKWAEETNEGTSGLVPEDEVERLRLSVRLARLALERAKNLEVADNPMHHLQWQVDRLRGELLRLRLEFERTRAGE